jgi:hypothetical protein
LDPADVNYKVTAADVGAYDKILTDISEIIPRVSPAKWQSEYKKLSRYRPGQALGVPGG